MEAVYLVAPVVLAAYYLWAISRAGRPPKLPPIVTRYDPPAGMSPAEARYAWKGVVDERTVACVLAQLAVLGRITISRDRGVYQISRVERPPQNSPALASEEQTTMNWLFANFFKRDAFDPHHDAQGLSMAILGALDTRLRGKYQTTHYGYIGLGMLASLAASFLLARATGAASSIPAAMIYAQFMTALLASIVTFGALLPAIIDLSRGIGSIGRIIFALAFSALAIAGTVGVAMKIRPFTPLAFSITVILLAVMNVVPSRWLRRITDEGIQARVELEGFREFLAAAEQDRLARSNPDPRLQPKEALLPFAIALEVRESWGDTLANECSPHLSAS